MLILQFQPFLIASAAILEGFSAWHQTFLKALIICGARDGLRHG
jgi:hypothetical protein